MSKIIFKAFLLFNCLVQNPALAADIPIKTEKKAVNVAVTNIATSADFSMKLTPGEATAFQSESSKNLQERYKSHLDTTMILPTDAIIVTNVMTNISTKPLRLSNSYFAEDDLRFSVSFSDGSATPLTQYGKSLEVQRASPFTKRRARTLNPGEAMTNVFHVNRQFDMTLEKEYLIKCSRVIQAKDGKAFDTLESNILRFFVHKPHVD